VERLLLIAGISAFGYLILPLAGAFRVRRQWRIFRQAIYRSMELPILRYRTVRSAPEGSGSFRFFGRIEASQGEDRLWLSDGSLSLQVDLKGVEIFTLPGFDAYDEEGRVEDNERAFADAAPSHVPSRRIAAFPQGTEIMVAGELVMERSRPVFHARSGTDLLVLVYDGDPSTILRRSIWSGRQRNEYWNQLTPLSLTLASFSLFILAYVFLRSPELLPYAHIALTFSLLPLAPLLPPGVLLFTLYRRTWRAGRYLRAERDLLSLPTRRFSESIPLCDGSSVRLPGGGIYRVRTYTDREEALEACREGKIRTSRALIDGRSGGRTFYAFCCTDEPRKGMTDPFAEAVLIPGEPRTLSAACSRGARIREFTAALFFLLAMISNTLIIFALLWAVLN
jgi:hypothetical protein